MSLSGAQALAKTLVALGVERIFGIPGAQDLELFDALIDEPIDVVLPTHEASAAFMADATARLTGRPGVIAVVPGPGLTNAITGIAEARLDSVPLLVIAGGLRQDFEYAYQLHEIPQLDVVRPLAKAVVPLRSVEEIPARTVEAWRTALAGEPGPVVLELPSDLGTARGPARIEVGAAPAPVEPDAAAVASMAERIRGARRVGIYVGQGVFGGEDALRELAERLGAPVATTISGRGALPEDHELAVGFGFGPSGHPGSEAAFAACDLVLAIGCKFGEVATGSYGLEMPGRLIHVDANPEVAGKNYAPDLFVAADGPTTLKRLLAALGDFRREADPGMKERIAAEKARLVEEALARTLKESQVRPERFFTLLRRAAARDAIVAVDSGNHFFWALSHYPVLAPRTFLGPVDYQAMGYGTPAAVAAALARPGRQTIAVVGDGCFLMSGIEILTAARNGLPVVVFVFNDGHLGIIAELQDSLYRRKSAVRLVDPDFEKLAAAFRMRFVRIAGDDEIEAKLAEALPPKGPTLVDVRVSYDEPTRYVRGATGANLRHVGMSGLLRLALRGIRRRFFPPPVKNPRVT